MDINELNNDTKSKIDLTEYQEIPVIKITGSLDQNLALEFNEVFKTFLTTSSKRLVILDFTDTNYINSTGIAALFQAYTDITNDGGKLMFANLSQHIGKVMEIVGLTEIIETYDVFQINN